MTFACPRCATALDERCPACGVRYPAIEGVPCVLHDAEQACGRFGLRFEDVARESADQLAVLERELASAELPETRARLGAFAEGVRLTAAAIAGIGASVPRASVENGIPSVAGHGALFEHYEYAFRDWAWGDDENARALDCVRAALDGVARPTRVLVLGAGAGRLAYDLHHALEPELTLALDVQPLLVLLARRMFAGEEVRLVEFAANHLSSPHAVCERTLRAPAPARPGLELAFADATRPPVRAGSFDLVVTPWLLDQLPCDVRDVLPGIHRALAEGGHWLFYGPLLHPRGKPYARCVTEAELLATLPNAGFTPREVHRTVLPYLCAPQGSGRSEPVLAFAARKQEGTRWSLPDWLTGLALPIPKIAAAPCDPIASAIASLVDGERSALAIADLLARRGLERHVALEATIAGLHALVRAAPPGNWTAKIRKADVRGFSTR